MTRVVFMGSPPAALPSLRALLAQQDLAWLGVVTQPPRRVGRGQHLQRTPVHTYALKRQLEVLTPRQPLEILPQLRAWQVDLLVVCAYGKILPQAVLDVPLRGCYNLHFSLLPRWRGASPVQAAILAGDAHTGVSLQRMVVRLDAGPLLAQTEPLAIAPVTTGSSLEDRLAQRAGQLLTDSWALLKRQDPPLVPQDENEVSVCRLVRKDEGRIRWKTMSAAQIGRMLRAYDRWPGCHTFLAPPGGTRGTGCWRLILERASVVADAESAAGGTSSLVATMSSTMAPGTLRRDGLVQTAKGQLRIERVKPSGKLGMPWDAFARGYLGRGTTSLLDDPIET